MTSWPGLRLWGHLRPLGILASNISVSVQYGHLDIIPVTVPTGNRWHTEGVPEESFNSLQRSGQGQGNQQEMTKPSGNQQEQGAIITSKFKEYYKLNCVPPQKIHVEVLTPHTSECDVYR